MYTKPIDPIEYACKRVEAEAVAARTARFDAALLAAYKGQVIREAHELATQTGYYAPKTDRRV